MSDVVGELKALMAADIRTKMGSDPSGELDRMPLPQLLISYYNWRARFVSAQPRRAHLSRELLADPQYVEHQPAVSAIVAKTESGGNLTPHLSKDISIAYQPLAERSSSLGPRRDLDRLQSEWSIHHLHLSTTIGRNGLVTRTKPLLFVIFQPGDAYLLGIFPHGAWTNTELVSAAVRNWPNANLFPQLQALGLASPILPEDRPGLRRAGLTTMVEVDGKIYAPPGQTLAGTPVLGTMWANEVMSGLGSLPEILDNLPPDIVDPTDQVTKYIGDNPEWEVFADHPSFGVREAKSGAIPFYIRVPD